LRSVWEIRRQDAAGLQGLLAAAPKDAWTFVCICADTAAVSLHFMYYNFGRPHQALTKRASGTKTTPAMAAGVADHVWSLTEIAILLDSNQHSN